jgi:hypothetical protein
MGWCIVEAIFRLLDLPRHHPNLLWETILTAAVAVLRDGGRESPFAFSLDVEGVHGFGSDKIEFLFDGLGVSHERVAQVRRTYELSRLVEMAAIAVAGAGLTVSGDHEIVDLAIRGSSADYVVDASHHHLEIAGRSRRVDLDAAWQQKWKRLRARGPQGCYVCVCEFETPAGRLAFADLAEGENHGNAPRQ